MSIRILQVLPESHAIPSSFDIIPPLITLIFISIVTDMSTITARVLEPKRQLQAILEEKAEVKIEQLLEEHSLLDSNCTVNLRCF